MGNDVVNCKCSCNKDNQTTQDFNNINNIETNKLINSSYDQTSKFKQYVNNKNNLKKPNITFLSNSVTQLDNSKHSFYNDPDNIKRIKIQSAFRGFYLRKIYNNYLKQKLIEEENQLIKDLTEHYTLFNLKRAESLIGTKFDKNGWKQFYSEKEEEIINFLNYNYGKTYYKKILIINGITPSFYTGEININYEMQGYGVLLKSDGTKYEGYWRKNFFTGWGRLIDIEGTLYEGYFINGYLNGKGIKKSLNGSIYIGEFKNNKKEGKGKEETIEHIYEGEFKNDKKNGNGKLSYKLFKDTYEGEFKDNCITGIGIYTWQNKDTYKGSFINGKMNGKGLYKWPDGGEYYGDYVDNIKEGNGKFKWINGRIFEGQFKKGRPDGLGKLIIGNININVEFKDGKLVTNIKEKMMKIMENHSKNNEDKN